MTSRGLLAAVLLASTTTSMAEEADAVYDNSVRVEYQFIRTGDLDTSLGAIDIGKTDTHVILLSGDYWLNDRWKLFASIPYVQKRHKGASVHDPVMDFVWFQPDFGLPDERAVQSLREVNWPSVATDWTP